MSNLLAHTETQIHDRKTGRLNAVAFGRILGLSTPRVAKMLGVTQQGIRQNPASTRIQEGLGRLVSLVMNIRQMFGGEMSAVKIWLNAPHPDLDRATPLKYLLDGHIEQVESLVDAYLSGQPD